mmetsp:Transcript_111647/g.204490  ORF Transcript_111647/g.204490 Transcript_111647/m.204490 type:complete len:96 (-) Transcript_111647:8-295(-)
MQMCISWFEAAFKYASNSFSCLHVFANLAMCLRLHNIAIGVKKAVQNDSCDVCTSYHSFHVFAKLAMCFLYAQHFNREKQAVPCADVCKSNHFSI